MTSHNEYESSLARDHKKKLGIFYTPKEITDYGVKRCFELYENLNANILDPTCGCGNFLLSAYEFLISKGIDKQQALNQLYGVDIDNKAVELTKELLPGSHTKHGNSLINTEFDFNLEFPNVMQNGGFDIVLANPPYIKHGQYKEYVEYLKKNSEIYHGRADLYTYFIEKSLNLLKDNGLLFVVTSNKWLLAGYAVKLRDYILKNTKIIEIHKHLNKAFFKTASVDTLIIILQKTKIGSDYEFTVYK